MNRQIAAVYEEGKVSIVEVEDPNLELKVSKSEEDLRQIWRNYYRHLGIEDRRNPREGCSTFRKVLAVPDGDAGSLQCAGCQHEGAS